MSGTRGPWLGQRADPLGSILLFDNWRLSEEAGISRDRVQPADWKRVTYGGMTPIRWTVPSDLNGNGSTMATR